MKALAHESATAHVTGRAIYTDEMALPANAIFLAPVLADLAHAKIISIDCGQAQSMPGVLGVLTHENIPGLNDTGPIVRDEVLLPIDTVSYHGQALAWVMAETEAQARAAAKMVRVQLEALPTILDIAQAQAQQSFHATPQLLQRGDARQALQAAPICLSGQLSSGAQDHFYLETHASAAWFDSADVLQVVSGTQHPSETQHIVAGVLGMAYHDIVVSCLRMGGGFGGKESQANAFAALAALASQLTKRPARIKLSREHDMRLTGKRHAFSTHYDVGFDQDGHIMALRAELIADAGWSMDLSPPVLMRAMVHVDNAYFLPNVEIVGKLAKTHKTSATAFRGFGGPQGLLVAEDIIERIAAHLGIAAEVVRARNFYRQGMDVTHFQQPIGEHRIARVWDELLASSDFLQRQQALKGIDQTQSAIIRGIAATPVKFGVSFNKVQYNQAGALVLIYTDGSVQINHGGTEMGQGLHSKMRAVAARTLGLDIDRIRIMTTATDKVPNTSATAASSGSDLNGQAIRIACETLIGRIKLVLCTRWQLDAGTSINHDATGFRTDLGHHASFLQAVSWAYDQRVSLSATGFYATPDLHWDMQTNTGQPFYYFSYGAAVSEVQINRYTGEWKLLRTDILHDVGDSLNAAIDIGQIEGGFVQGMGWLTMEEVVWDDTGRLKTFAPSTYKIPTICEVPEQFHTALLTRATQPGVIFGSKAVGEPPLMLAISVRSALKQAIGASCAGRDHVELSCPATPEAILRALHERADRAI